MRAAGEELGVTHAAVSTTVSRLEKRLGVDLFDRQRGVLSPTAACLEMVEAFVTASRSIRSAMTNVGLQAPQAMRVSIPRCAAVAWLSSSLARLQAVAPGAVVGVHGDEADPDFSQLDAAVVAGGPNPPAGFDGEVLFDEEIAAVCSPAYADRHDLETPAALARLPLLIHSRKAWRAWLAHAGLYSEPMLRGIEVEDPSLGLQGALSGQGLALACTVVAAHSIAEGRLVAPLKASLPTGRRIWVVWPKSSRRLEPALIFCDWVLAELETVGRRPMSDQTRAARLGAR
jgi:DNA-binding transcriptional LysR family regulator